MKRNVQKLWCTLAAFCVLAVAGQTAEKPTPAEIRVDNRGLIEISGFLRASSDSEWGASNLILKPVGGWAAQDYCLEGAKKEGDIITAVYNTKPKMNMTETAELVKKKSGETEMNVSYVFTPVEGDKATFERVFLTFPIATADFGGGTLIANGKTKVKLPVDKEDKEIELPPSVKSLTVTNGSKVLTLKAEGLKFSVKDLRPKSSAFQIVLESPGVADLSELKLQFSISAETKPVK